jgi:putative dimethyl sulfoxide reductase chaperone
MQTPSEELQNLQGSVGHEEWGARSSRRPSSIFSNYRPKTEEPAHTFPESPEVGYSAPQRAARREGKEADLPLAGAGMVQELIDVALARSFVYQFLAKAYEDPTEEDWSKLSVQSFQEALQSATDTLAAGQSPLAESARQWHAQLKPETFDAFLTAYLAAFGHAARGRCPLNEIEYGEIKADPLFQPHRLADLAAFYRAFGLEVTDDADERQDHICLELEFMCVLTAKEAYALEHQLGLEELSICRAAEKMFLREHLGRWTPGFTRRLARMARGTPLAALACFTGAFVETECARFGIAPGSEDLLLRPVDEASESLCASCAAAPVPATAMAPTRP